jgi:hypothetical protein
MKAIESGKESPPIQDTIPLVVRYDYIKHQVPKGLSLLGIHPEYKCDNSICVVGAPSGMELWAMRPYSLSL